MGERKSSKLMKFATLNSTFSHLHDAYDFIVNPDGTALNALQGRIICIFAQALGIPFEVVFPEENTFGAKNLDGNWTGIMGMLVRGEADICTSGMTITSERQEAVNFTFPIHVDDFTFKTNKAEPYPKNFAILETFALEVWFCIGISLILTSFLLYILLNRKQQYSILLLETLGNLLEKSFSFEVRQRNTVFMLLTWFLGITVLSNSYKAVILSVITIPRMVGVRDISDLSKAVKDSSFRCIMNKASSRSNAWFESNDDRLRSIRKCMKRSEIENLYDMPAFLKYPYKKAFFANRIAIGEYDKNYFISDDSFSLSHIGIAYTGSFCCPRKLENLVLRIFEADLYQKYIRDRDFRAQFRQPRLENFDYDNTYVLPLTLKDLTGAFLVLFIGYFLSLVAFIIEIMLKSTILKNNDIKALLF